MSKEQKFHKLIRNQNSEEKETLWNKIEQQTVEEQINLGGVVAKEQQLSKQYKILICVVALLVAVVGITLIYKFISPNSVDDGFRYCEFGDYYSVDSDESISEYAEVNNVQLLFFDWYEEAEYYADTQYKLNSNDEVICLYEELSDVNGFYIIQYVTDIKTQIDFLNAYSESCKEQAIINTVNVKYGILMETTLAYFSYGNYNYYFKLESTDEDYMLKLLDTLIK